MKGLWHHKFCFWSLPCAPLIGRRTYSFNIQTIQLYVIKVLAFLWIELNIWHTAILILGENWVSDLDLLLNNQVLSPIIIHKKNHLYFLSGKIERFYFPKFINCNESWRFEIRYTEHKADHMITRYHNCEVGTSIKEYLYCFSRIYLGLQ